MASLFFAYKFFSQTQALQEEKNALIKKTESLEQDKASLKNKLTKTEKDRNELSQQLKEARSQLDSIEEERDFFKNKYDTMQSERDELLEKVQELQKGNIIVEPGPSVPQAPVAGSGDAFWEETLRQKAELEIKLNDLLVQVQEKDLAIRELERVKKVLESENNQLKGDNRELKNDLSFKERTIELLTKNLVREMEDRKFLTVELDEAKRTNGILDRDLRSLTAIQSSLEKSLQKVKEERSFLLRKVKHIEVILKEKALEIDSLQRQLSNSINSVNDKIYGETVSARAVELPPIVVRSDNAVTMTGKLQGRVLAVNDREKFLIVDVGRTAGVNAGDRLALLRNGQQIGALTVIETREDVAACDMSQIYSGSAREGDVVVSLGR